MPIIEQEKFFQKGDIFVTLRRGLQGNKAEILVVSSKTENCLDKDFEVAVQIDDTFLVLDGIAAWVLESKLTEVLGDIVSAQEFIGGLILELERLASN